MRTWLTILAAALIGYVAASWKSAVVEAARDDAETLMELVREFDEATSRDRLEGWVSFFAEDAIMLPVGQKMVAGREKIRELMASSFADPSFQIRWEPIGAEASGNLGYTYGLYQTSRMQDDKRLTSHGKYLTVWRKVRRGEWKVVADMGNTDPAPRPE
jgi:ketosteroid isomerase-like protein